MNRSLITYSIIFCLLMAIGFALWSVLSAAPTSNNSQVGNVPQIEKVDLNPSSLVQGQANNTPETSEDSSTQNLNATEQIALPKDIRLIGTQTAVPKIALLESDGAAEQFQIGDMIFGFDIELVDIAAQHVIVTFNNTSFTIPLIGPNLIANEVSETDQSFNKMTAAQIGNRPKILEHVMTFSASTATRKGAFASPGLNPKLFAQAGLREGDLVLSINDKDITNSEQLAQLQSSFPQADTFVFKVERNGGIISLYLDIPSRALTIR